MRGLLWANKYIELIQKPDEENDFWLYLPQDECQLIVDREYVMVKIPRETMFRLAEFIITYEVKH